MVTYKERLERYLYSFYYKSSCVTTNKNSNEMHVHIKIMFEICLSLSLYNKTLTRMQQDTYLGTCRYITNLEKNTVILIQNIDNIFFSQKNSVFSQKNLHVGIHEARHTKNWRIWSFSIFASLWWYLLLLLAPHSVLFMGPHTKQKSIDSNMVVFPFHRTFSSLLRLQISLLDYSGL